MPTNARRAVPPWSGDRRSAACATRCAWPSGSLPRLPRARRRSTAGSPTPRSTPMAARRSPISCANRRAPPPRSAKRRRDGSPRPRRWNVLKGGRPRFQNDAPSRRADALQELIDLPAQRLRLPSKLLGRRQDLRGGGAGLARRLADRANIAGDLLGALGGLLRVAGHLQGRRALSEVLTGAINSCNPAAAAFLAKAVSAASAFSVLALKV